MDVTICKTTGPLSFVPELEAEPSDGELAALQDIEAEGWCGKDAVEPLRRNRPDAPDAPRRQGVEKGPDPVRFHLHESIRLGGPTGDLGHHLDGPDANRHRQ